MTLPNEPGATEDRSVAPRMPGGGGRQVIPDFACTPRWVRAFYFMPVLGRFAKHWMRERGRYRPSPPAAGGDGWWDERGVREPRRPSPLAGAGAVALDEPMSEWPEDDVAGSVALALLDPEAPTTAA